MRLVERQQPNKISRSLTEVIQLTTITKRQKTEKTQGFAVFWGGLCSSERADFSPKFGCVLSVFGKRQMSQKEQHLHGPSIEEGG